MADFVAPLTFPRSAVRPYTLAIASTAIALIVGVGGGAVVLPTTGAIVAQGRVVAEGYDVRVQAGEVGRIQRLSVHEGQSVAAGDTLFQLQQDQQLAAYQALHSERLDLEAQEQRLTAQAGLRPTPGLRPAFTLRPVGVDDAAPFRQHQQALLAAENASRARRLMELRQEQAAQAAAAKALRSEAGLQQSQVDINQTELPHLKKLYDEGYAPLSALNAAELRARSLAAERQQMLAQAAQADDKVASYRLEAAQLDAQQKADTIAELNQVEARLADVRPRENSAAEQLKSLEVRAPHSGTVHELQLHSTGEMVAVGEVTMMIVPNDGPLAIDLFVDPGQVDQVATGQSVRIRLRGSDPIGSPDLKGRVTRVSSDVERDSAQGKAFYVAHIVLPKSEWNRLGSVRPRPGLPVDGYIAERPRTLFSYLVGPLTDRFSRAIPIR